MYKIDKASNTIHQLEMKSFSSLGFRERDHLQEWIAQKPSVLGEELLIIQKEFSGFDETQERLDLLALDKQGALVIIENKLDDSGKDVTWQALKYASYCSGFTKNNIAKIYQQHLDKHDNGASAEERLTEFFGGVDFDEIRLNQGVTQRIILIAAKFRKEVPGMTIRTSLIVGYPGETEEDFQELKDWVSDTKFDRLGVFTYSHEENTHAFLLEDDVPEEVKHQRAEEIMEVQSDISYQLNQKKVGKTIKVLFDRKEGEYFIGRSEFDSPDVDNEVLLKAKDTYIRMGDFANVKITHADHYDLYGELV